MKNKSIIILSIATLFVAISDCECVKEMICDVKSKM